MRHNITAYHKCAQDKTVGSDLSISVTEATE